MSKSSKHTLEFDSGFATGFRVPVAERLENAIANKRLSQGDIFYSSKEAYAAATWSDTVRSISWAIQIRESMTGGETVLFEILEPRGHQLSSAGTFKLHWDDFLQLLKTADFEAAKVVNLESRKTETTTAPKEYQLKSAPLSNDASPAPALNLKYRVGREIDELLGLCRGIISDGLVVGKEISFLESWLKKNKEAVKWWPAKPLAERVQRILADGVVTADERSDLALFLEKITAEGADQITKVNELLIQNSVRSTTLPIDEPAPTIQFSEHRFCFTGKFLSGTRQWCELETERRGGIPDDANSCHFLVIGVLGSRDWAHSAFGRKIEAAMQRRGAKATWPKIVAESHWLETLNTTPRLPHRA